jgi:hypothetical protein
MPIELDPRQLLQALEKVHGDPAKLDSMTAGGRVAGSNRSIDPETLRKWPPHPELCL